MQEIPSTQSTGLKVVAYSLGPRPCDVRITTQAANGACLAPRSEHRISRNDQTVVLFGIDGGQPTRSPISLGFVIPEARTRPRVGECEPPWRWNRNPMVTPEHQ